MGKPFNQVFFGEGVVDPRSIFVSDDPADHLSAFLNALNEAMEAIGSKMDKAGAGPDRGVIPVLTVSVSIEGGRHHPLRENAPETPAPGATPPTEGSPAGQDGSSSKGYDHPP